MQIEVLTSIYIRTRLHNTIGVVRILDWGRGEVAEQENHIGEDQKKRVFIVRFKICDWGKPKFSWRPILDWGGAKPQVTEWGPNL